MCLRKKGLCAAAILLGAAAVGLRETAAAPPAKTPRKVALHPCTKLLCNCQNYNPGAHYTCRNKGCGHDMFDHKGTVR